MGTQKSNLPEENLVEFLKAEAEKNKRLEKKTWIIGLSVSAIMVGYLTYIGVQYKATVLNPYHLGPVVASKIDRQAPEIIKETEAYFRAEAPHVAEQCHQATLSMVTVMGEAGRKRIDLLVELIPTLHDASKSVTDRFFAIYGDKIKTFYDGHYQAADEEKFVVEVVDAILKKMEKQIVADVFGSSMKDLNSQGLSEISVFHLREINKYLNSLARKPSLRMTRLERMQRRLIVAWVKAMSKGLQLNLGASSR